MSLCTSGFASGRAAEPLAAPAIDLLVYVALLHVLLVCEAIAMHIVHHGLLAVVLGRGCQWNSSWTVLMLLLVYYVAVDSDALQEDFLMGLASCECFAWNVGVFV